MGTLTLALDYAPPGEEPDRHRAYTYSFPDIDSSFSSPLVNQGNFAVSGNSYPQRVLARVERGLKAVGFVDQRDSLEPEAIKAQAAGLVTRSRWVGPPAYQNGHNFLSVAVPGRISDLFDLEALLADYQAYFKNDQQLTRSIETELKRIAPLATSDFLEFKEVEVDRRRDYCRGTPGSWVRCGLLLGYPVPSTVACIGHEWAYPGCSTTSLP